MFFFRFWLDFLLPPTNYCVVGSAYIQCVRSRSFRNLAVGQSLKEKEYQDFSYFWEDMGKGYEQKRLLMVEI